MKRVKLGALKIALIGLGCFLAAGLWTAVRVRLALAAQLKEMQKLMPASGGSFDTNSAWSTVPLFDPALLLGIAGLALFVGGSLYHVTKIISRRLRPGV
jgi:hypothetical protein